MASRSSACRSGDVGLDLAALHEADLGELPLDRLPEDLARPRRREGVIGTADDLDGRTTALERSLGIRAEMVLEPGDTGVAVAEHDPDPGVARRKAHERGLDRLPLSRLGALAEQRSGPAPRRPQSGVAHDLAHLVQG